MALEKVSNILQEAEKRNTSAIAFDAFDYQTIYSCIMGAEAVKKPVILMLYPTMDSLITPRIFAGDSERFGKKSKRSGRTTLGSLQQLRIHTFGNSRGIYFGNGRWVYTSV